MGVDLGTDTGGSTNFKLPAMGVGIMLGIGLGAHSIRLPRTDPVSSGSGFAPLPGLLFHRDRIPAFQRGERSPNQ